MWKKELIKNKIYAVILMCGGALAIPWCDGGCNVLFIFPDDGDTAVLCKRKLDL